MAGSRAPKAAFSRLRDHSRCSALTDGARARTDSSASPLLVLTAAFSSVWRVHASGSTS